MSKSRFDVAHGELSVADETAAPAAFEDGQRLGDDATLLSDAASRTCARCVERWPGPGRLWFVGLFAIFVLSRRIVGPFLLVAYEKRLRLAERAIICVERDAN